MGLTPSDDWNAYTFKDRPGLILIRNPFTSIGQRYWIKRFCEDFTKHPNPNNLLPSRFNEKVIKDFWGSLNNEPVNSQRRLIKKSMRWCTLGYHYDWTNKIYDESYRSEFPADLHHLVSSIAEALGFEKYKSEAAIINFYPIGTTLSAHTDHSEYNLESPLFSMSFGQPALFLIGGTGREDEALPILLRSGDILVMSKQSRLCYHAVPRVFSSDLQPWNTNEDITQSFDLPQEEVEQCLKADVWRPFEEYLIDCRINVNVRQVNKWLKRRKNNYFCLRSRNQKSQLRIIVKYCRAARLGAEIFIRSTDECKQRAAHYKRTTQIHSSKQLLSLQLVEFALISGIEISRSPRTYVQRWCAVASSVCNWHQNKLSKHSCGLKDDENHLRNHESVKISVSKVSR